jgi:structural maintenance of chromosome 1
VNKVSSFISKKSKKCQFLVISLKDTFFSKANSLIGIYKDRNDKCSKSLTFDLSKYQEKEEEEEEELLETKNNINEEEIKI